MRAATLEAEGRAILAEAAGRSLLRVLTCGSVDDGKSTLIGRLLHETGQVPDDQMAAIARASARHGTTGAEPDLALLVDGLEAEREQGITIDIAWRYFTTPGRAFILADAPGHEQFTRNMATAASTADCAILLVDARHGILPQTRRHAFILGLMGVRHLLLAVNKMDLVGWSQTRFEAVAREFAAVAGRLGLPLPVALPLCARGGDNVAAPSPHLGWFAGPTLLAQLESIEPVGTAAHGPFRLPVQWVARNGERRGLAGTVASGNVRPGDPVLVAPGGQAARVAAVLGPGGHPLSRASAGEAVTLTLDRPVDCGRGAVIAAAAAPVEGADQFEARIVWMDETALVPGRAYLLKSGAASAIASLSAPKHAIDMESFSERPAPTLRLNDIGTATLTVRRPIPFAPYAEDRTLGGFILIDRETNATVAAGTISFALRRSGNISWQSFDVTRQARERQLGQRACVLWFTGLSGAGKSTIANLVERRLHGLGHATMLLDGDNVRHGLNKDLGFKEADRVENVRRVGEVARLMADAGLVVLTAFISPFRAEREMVRAMLPEGLFVEIHIDTPLEVAEARDPKGLYAKARRGALVNFTGIDSPYQPPEAPEIRIDTVALSAEEAAQLIVEAVLPRIAPA